MSEIADMDSATLRQALSLVRQLTGITMVAAKQSMLQARLRQRMRALQLRSYEEYLQRLARDPSERQPFIDVVTTHHTTFFRTPKVWQHVREEFLPAWVERHAGQTLRVWSAAASSGEEACSIAICCEEQRRQLAASAAFSYEIIGTDIAADVLANAEKSEYAGNSMNAFRTAHPELFARYNCSGSAECFRLVEDLRKRITFATHNLMEPSRWRDRFDLIFLRNVLIYFQKSDIETIVRNVAPALRKDGLLIIGEAESLAAMDVPFQFVRPQIYRLSEQ